MPNYSTQNLRTIALVGHAGAGKTSLAEQLLAKSGMIGAPGAIERGSTVCDHDPLEKAAGHSLRAAICHIDYKNTRIHLIDTPGHPDLLGQSLGALDAVETVAIVINATSGIELMTRRMVQWAAARKRCCMIIINRIDAESVALPALVKQLQEAFGPECLPINLPAEGGTRVIDCFANDSGKADFLSVAEVHRSVIEQVVEVDEAAMARYLEDGEADPETLHAPLEQALREGHLIPICFVSARTGAGVLDLLEVFTRHLPHPGEGNSPLFVRGSSPLESFHAAPDPSQHVLAHVFKVVNDPYVGRVGVFRVHQGIITRDTQLYLGDGRKAFKIAHPLLLQGKEMVEVTSLVPGDIGAVAKIDEIEFDCVLHNSHDEDLVRMQPLQFPAPMFGLAVSPKRRGDEARLSDVLAKIASEDPSLRVEHDVSMNETLLRGLSELHLRAVLERMAVQYKLEVATHPPRIPYRETITAPAEGFARHKKQTGGAGQFGEVHLRIEPLPRGAGFEFLDQVKGGVIPNQFMPAVEKGVRQVLAAGPVAAFPMQDVRVMVYDGKYHPVDSKEVAFVAAGRKAFLDALTKARPIVLEPIVDIEVECPATSMGDVTGDLRGRRGQVTGTVRQNREAVSVTGQVPLAEIDGYATRLKSFTAGQGSYAMTFSHYEPAPPTVQQRLASEHQGRRKEVEE